MELKLIAQRLAMASLPDELVMKELGPAGPIVGTIHSSKGREARTVFLMLGAPPDDIDVAEGRVLYVGLSRAKEVLHVRRVIDSHWSHLPSGRPWRRSSTGSIQVEIGRTGDVDPVGSAAAAGAGIELQQAILADFDGIPRDLRIRTNPNEQWRRELRLGDPAAPPLSVLSRGCCDELRDVAQAVRKAAKTPMGLDHVRWFDVTTTALPADHPMLVDLPEPWRTTRVMLAPVVAGLARIPSVREKT